ncbi:MAG: SWIM zinc finger family protein [Solirubrobacteraceae bacterium]
MFATTDPGLFFDGFTEHPAVAARGMLAIAEIARARFHPQMSSGALHAVADPVLTAEPGRLRFESFSRCCGVHARLDLLDGGLDVRALSPGTTNVDFGESACHALAGITRRDPLRLTVGTNAVQLSTPNHDVLERRVPLPERWLKGFGEVQVATPHGEPTLRLDGIAATRFLSDLPRGTAGRITAWVLPSPQGARLATHRVPGAIALTGPARLQALRPLAPLTRSLRAYATTTDQPTATAWVIDLDEARVTLTLSPAIDRGFSGEGGLLVDLASPQAAPNAASLRRQLADHIPFTLETCTATGLSQPAARAALTWLGMHGQLGHDVSDGTFFWRRLPYPSDALAKDPPRLRDARQLLSTGAIHPVADHSYRVLSKDNEYRITLGASESRCTCPWIAKYGTSRGPCKHILACVMHVHMTPFPAAATSITR